MISFLAIPESACIPKSFVGVASHCSDLRALRLRNLHNCLATPRISSSHTSTYPSRRSEFAVITHLLGLGLVLSWVPLLGLLAVVWDGSLRLSELLLLWLRGRHFEKPIDGRGCRFERVLSSSNCRLGLTTRYLELRNCFALSR